MNRAVMAARAQANPSINKGPNFPLGMAEPVQSRHGKPGRRGKRPGSDKGQGLWRTTSPYYTTSATIDVRWSATRSAS